MYVFLVVVVAFLMFLMAGIVALKFYFPVVSKVVDRPYRTFLDDFLTYVVFGCLLLIAVIF